MKRIIPTLLALVILLSGAALQAQSGSAGLLPANNSTHFFCGERWVGNQRLYLACLAEQREAMSRIQALQGQYGSQRFWRDVAFPFCRATASAESLDLVHLHYCLNDEVEGYRFITDLRQLYGAGRVDALYQPALASSGSWAAAAAQVKRNGHLKRIRRGATS